MAEEAPMAEQTGGGVLNRKRRVRLLLGATKQQGLVAHLGERRICNAEVTGAEPVGSN